MPLSLFADASHLHSYFSGASLVVALALLVAMLVNPGKALEPEQAQAEAAKPIPSRPANKQAEAEIVSFLATLQERGRLVDFLMDDVTTYNDAQVGAAARVVHEGCKAVSEGTLEQSTRARRKRGSSPLPSPRDIQPMSIVYRQDQWGSAVLGNACPSRLENRGGETATHCRVDADRLPTIAPAEVELK